MTKRWHVLKLVWALFGSAIHHKQKSSICANSFTVCEVKLFAFVLQMTKWWHHRSRPYSRGQAKSPNKNGSLLMPEKMTGKHPDTLREASGQISPKFHEPLSRKCLYKEIVPEILTDHPKSAGKNRENCAIASFHWEESVHQFSKQVIKPFSWKKMPNIDLNWVFCQVWCVESLHITHCDQETSSDSIARVHKCGEQAMKRLYLWLPLVSDRTPTTSANSCKISAHLAHFLPQMLHILGPKIWLHQFLVGKTSEVCFSTYFANRNKNLKKSWP